MTVPLWRLGCDDTMSEQPSRKRSFTQARLNHYTEEHFSVDESPIDMIGHTQDGTMMPITPNRRQRSRVEQREEPPSYNSLDASYQQHLNDDYNSIMSRQTPNECFFCGWGDPALYDRIHAPHITIIHDILNSLYGHIENSDLATMLVLYYNEHVYLENCGMPQLNHQIALRHIEQHTLEPRIFIGESLRAWGKVKTILANKICYQNGNVDHKSIKSMNEVEKSILNLYKLDPSKMNFYNNNRDIDLKLMGRYTTLTSKFEQDTGETSDTSPEHSDISEPLGFVV
jgi:hypothetical protein